MFISITGCKESSSNYMVLDEIKYINKFPKTFCIMDGTDENLDIIGVKNFIIHDSIMIFSTTDSEGLWSFYSLSEKKNLGSFFKIGNGPFEFVQPQSVGDKVKICSEDNTLYAYIYDFHRGKVLKMNISESIKKQALDISIHSESFPPFLFNFVFLDSCSYFYKQVNDNYTQQIRSIIQKDIKQDSYFIDKLNKTSIREGEDINILSTITKMNDHHKIIEMPIGLNYINIYSLDNTFNSTICVGSQLDNIEEIQGKKAWNRIYTFADLRLFDNFWGVVQINEDEKSYQTERKKLPLILLFDWKGDPLAELKLNRHITSFDIDIVNGNLYTFDVHSDEFMKYDIKDILAKLE